MKLLPWLYSGALRAYAVAAQGSPGATGSAMPKRSSPVQWTVRGHVPPAELVTKNHLPGDVAEPGGYWQLRDLRVASFATDHPDVIVEAVQDYYAAKP